MLFQKYLLRVVYYACASWWYIIVSNICSRMDRYYVIKQRGFHFFSSPETKITRQKLSLISSFLGEMSSTVQLTVKSDCLQRSQLLLSRGLILLEATMRFRASSRCRCPQGQGTFIFWRAKQKKSKMQFRHQVKPPPRNKKSSSVCNVGRAEYTQESQKEENNHFLLYCCTVWFW